ncbi:MAG: glycosyltransferase family 4 protein [Bacillota bacterium]|nr:glycosyltransferase family 4 protein [Bacillota bacterium]
MNILFLINYAGNSGSEKYVDNLQRLFTQKGHTCYFAYNVPGKLSETMNERGVTSFQLPLTSSDISSSAKLLGKFCEDNRIDVIHAQFPVENIIAIKACKYYKNMKVVFTSHLSDKQGLKWKILNKINTPKNHKIICVCDEGKENLIASGIDSNKIKVIYNGIEYDDSEVKTHSNTPFKMITIARYAPEKGLMFLLDALCLVKQRTIRPFTCTIIGEGEEFELIKAKAKELGLEKEIIQTGYREDAEDFLKDSDLYLNSSKSGEAMSFAMLEAMNAGLPLVVTNVGGNDKLSTKDIVCGKTVEYGDKLGFANAVIEYMENDSLLLEHRKEAKRKVKTRYSLSKLADEVLATYN